MSGVLTNKISDVPIFIIGAGGIVQQAHLPAYRAAGYHVEGIFDLDVSKAEAVAAQYEIPKVFSEWKELISNAPVNAVFDLAVPASALPSMVERLPEGAFVLMQKPMGENFQSARLILQTCRKNNLQAAVNFQLRYAPAVLSAKEMIKAGKIGTLCDILIHVNVYTPWHLWDFLATAPRVEILYHSIHYIDLIRSFWGNPRDIYAHTFKHPDQPQLDSVKSTIIMNHGELKRAVIHTNHSHDFGVQHQESYIQLEGTQGCIRISLGALINYPHGGPDAFEFIWKENNASTSWQQEKISGNWFPDAFAASMKEVLLMATGEKINADNSVEDCIHTMACVEAAYTSSLKGGTPLPE